MGGWKLEVFKMGLYVTFPVGMFVLFNSPMFYEDAIYEARRKWMQSVDTQGCEDLQRTIDERKREKLTRAIEEIKARKPIS
ncbi:hypothetical protein HDE_13738 [Halotydeus destructor]|nr:hypothetical protein HDE_13738 [Halotydeus destructor]